MGLSRHKEYYSIATHPKGLISHRQGRLFSILPLQADGPGYIVEFFSGNLGELLAFGGEFFVNLKNFFGHRLVSFGRAAKQHKIWTRG